MPERRKEEPREKFMRRCIPVVISEGTAKNEKQAVAICSSIFEKGKGAK